MSCENDVYEKTISCDNCNEIIAYIPNCKYNDNLSDIGIVCNKCKYSYKNSDKYNRNRIYHKLIDYGLFEIISFIFLVLILISLIYVLDNIVFNFYLHLK
jgi:hypothetical protein